MNEKLFQSFQNAADPGLLEEAQAAAPRRRIWIPIAATATAACLCLVAVGVLLRQPAGQGDAQLVNPVKTATVADLQALGYSMPLPAEAKDVSYATIDREADAIPMAQASFTVGDKAYTYRSLKTETAEDISGLFFDWEKDLRWTAASLELQLRATAAQEACVSWYDPGSQTQWSLSGEGSSEVLHTATEILKTLGYSVDVAPADATDVTYNVLELDGLTVAETAFTLDGVHWVYRTAATGEVSEDFADISGLADLDASSAGSVRYCPARLSWEEGKSGKIVWFDMAPGLLYSISMDTDASEEALTSMAEQLFAPAQGDVG